MELIDKKELIETLKKSPVWTGLDAMARINAMDTIDIVRCKECRHKYQEPWHNGVKVEGECEIWHNATLDDDFCSYGERKESE